MLTATVNRFKNLPINGREYHGSASQETQLIMSLVLNECLTVQGDSHEDSTRFRSRCNYITKKPGFTGHRFTVRLIDHPQTGERCVGIWRIA